MPHAQALRVERNRLWDGARREHDVVDRLDRELAGGHFGVEAWDGTAERREGAQSDTATQALQEHGGGM